MFDLTTEPEPALGLHEPPARSSKFPIMLAILVMLLSRFFTPTAAVDWLNLLPALAAAYLLYCIVAPRRTLGYVGFNARSLTNDPGVRKPPANVLFSVWVRASLLLPMVFLIVEFLLRCGSYHRTVYYERRGDLLFTPAPNQQAIEKISLTPSHINNYGLRGSDITADDLKKRVILCLGDSITYGYGVDDRHTYPAQLQAVLDRKYPNQFTVLNGGVNAYPVSFMHQKFLDLWNRGIRPDTVIVGYSMNEGWLGHLVESDDATKDQFARRVRLKNFLRSSAVYNLVVENWGIVYYERVKEHMIPGTHTVDWSDKSYYERYAVTLAQMLADLRARNIEPVFLVLSAFDGQTGRYDTDGFLQKQFVEFAMQHGIPFLRSDEVFRAAASGTDIEQYFRDGCHMNERGTAELAGQLAELLPGFGVRQANVP